MRPWLEESTGDVKKLFSSPSCEVGVGKAAVAGDGVRLRLVELLLLRSPFAPEEVRFALWTPHKSGECWAERNTPTWSLSVGLPKQFHVIDLQTVAHKSQRTATR